MAVKLRKGAVKHVLNMKAKAGKKITVTRARKIARRKTAMDTYYNGKGQKFDYAGDGLGKRDVTRRSQTKMANARSGHRSRVKKKADALPSVSGSERDGGGSSAPSLMEKLKKQRLYLDNMQRDRNRKSTYSDAEISAGRKEKMRSSPTKRDRAEGRMHESKVMQSQKKHVRKKKGVVFGKSTSDSMMSARRRESLKYRRETGRSTASSQKGHKAS